MSSADDSLAAAALLGDRWALARLLTEVENGTRRGLAALRELYPRTGRAHTIGITGSPGSGKSTCTSELAKVYRARGKSVGIVAVDPSSPYTQGAILGDRVRMQELAADIEIFIRSLASRGALGGLSETTRDVVAVLDAVGKDVVLIETVGAGQDEVEIVGAAQTTVLINTPGMGDDIQVLKAGIIEIADVLAANKADLPGADVLMGQLRALLSFSPDKDWTPPIVRMVATQRDGITDLADACDQHYAFLLEPGRLAVAERARARRHLLTLTRQRLLTRLMARSGDDERFEALVDAVAERRLDPHSAAEEWIVRPTGTEPL